MATRSLMAAHTSSLSAGNIFSNPEVNNWYLEVIGVYIQKKSYRLNHISNHRDSASKKTQPPLTEHQNSMAHCQGLTVKKPIMSNCTTALGVLV